MIFIKYLCVIYLPAITSRHCLSAVFSSLHKVTQFLSCYEVFTCMFLCLAEIPARDRKKNDILNVSSTSHNFGEKSDKILPSQMLFLTAIARILTSAYMLNDKIVNPLTCKVKYMNDKNDFFIESVCAGRNIYR